MSLSAPGATSAPCLIFIFPAIFYIRIMPKDKEPLRSTPKILVSMGKANTDGNKDGGPGAGLGALSPWLSLTPCPVPAGCLLCPPWGALHDHELELHHHRLGHGGGEERRQPLASTGRPRQPPPHPWVPQGKPALGSAPVPWPRRASPGTLCCLCPSPVVVVVGV